MLAYVREGNVDYVLVHKLDRLARDRADDVMILATIQVADAVLVSATESIDETPSGMLMHGIKASMAEFYSRNLANEAKKGIAQKAMNGGTHGVAPIGYVNTLARIEGREVKGVAFDEEKVEHIRWAFQTYATGQWSILTLRDELEVRGLKSRSTLKYVGTRLNNSQVHRLLSNPYYMGKVRHREIIYDGAHQPLVDAETWHLVQDILAGRRIAGDRSAAHPLPQRLLELPPLRWANGLRAQPWQGWRLQLLLLPRSAQRPHRLRPAPYRGRQG
jgi:site-specific DNA recombinase